MSRHAPTARRAPMRVQCSRCRRHLHNLLHPSAAAVQRGPPCRPANLTLLSVQLRGPRSGIDSDGESRKPARQDRRRICARTGVASACCSGPAAREERDRLLTRPAR